MGFGNLLLLLLATCIATSNARLENQAPALRHLSTPANGKLARDHGAEIANTHDAEIEERFFSSLTSRVKVLLGKNAAITNTISDLRKQPGILKGLNNPSVKRMEAAIEKDPNLVTKLANSPDSLKKLRNDPGISQAVTAVEKANVKINMGEVQAALEKAPSMRQRLRGRVKGSKEPGAITVAVSLGGLFVMLLVLAIAYHAQRSK